MNKNSGGPNIKITGGNLTLSDSSLSNNSETLLYAFQSNVDISSTTFTNGGSFQDEGGAIYCDCNNIQIVKSTFTSNKAAAGGSIYLIGGPTGTQKIYSNYFGQNVAQQGGGIAVVTANQLDIRGNNFTQNQAV